MAGLQSMQYVVLTVNIRAISHEQYLSAGATAGLASLMAYTIVRRIVKNESKWGIAGMITGGFLADIVGIYLTRAWS